MVKWILDHLEQWPDPAATPTPPPEHPRRSNVAFLLAGIIALQNMPEGFAAYHELGKSGMSRKSLWAMFLSALIIGPLAAWLGYYYFSSSEGMLGFILLFCSGGILYLIFQDIAPEARIARRSFPAIGAVLGFLLGMVGTMVLH